MKKMEVFGLQTIPQIKQEDNLAEIIIKCSDDEIGGLKDKDIIVLTSKIVSKALGRMRKLSEVVPGKKALAISRQTGKDAKRLQLIFGQGHQILAIMPLKGVFKQHIMNASEDKDTGETLCQYHQAVCITKGPDGRIYSFDSGIDGSNHPEDVVSLLPEDPDAEARKIREQIQKLTGKQVAVILADTEMIPFGTMDFAVGSSGIEPRQKMCGKVDSFGTPKLGGMDLTAHELSAASALLFGQVDEGIPVVVIRGFEYEISETENISNTILSQAKNTDVAKAIKATMQATAYAQGFKRRLLLKIASWFI